MRSFFLFFSIINKFLFLNFCFNIDEFDISALSLLFCFHEFEAKIFNANFVFRFLNMADNRIATPEKNKCIDAYYNRTGPLFLGTVYEGIPENLILNFIGWIVSKSC